MKLWWYNNIKRPWANLYIFLLWYWEGKPTDFCPKIGKITPKILEWAKSVYEKSS